MKILVNIYHPAHVHFFKNMIWNLENKGHEVMITARSKEVTFQLLNSYGFEYVDLGKHYTSLFCKSFGMVKLDYILYKIANKFKPDVITGIIDTYGAHVAKLSRKHHIVFTDTENVKISGLLTYPLTNTICTPSCFREKLDPKKHIRYNGYHELTYLHPNYFQSDSSVLDDLNLSKDDKFIVLRFISWAASHDFGLKGIKKDSELDFIKKIEEYGKVFITSERKLSPEMEKYRITCSPEKIHSLLYYSQLYVGEGGTMAVESAILGTPAVHIESNSSGVATGNSSGNFLELRDKYDLLYFYPNQTQALERAIEILENKNSKKKWQKKREKLLEDKIDVTAWMTDFIERYPKSFYEYKSKVIR